MAAPVHHTAVSQETPITIKITVDNESVRKLKLPLKDLGASTLPNKLREFLGIEADQIIVLERFSDSEGGYVVLDPTNPAVFRTLIRAAKAKLKLRIKATITPAPAVESVKEEEEVKLEPVEAVTARCVPVMSSINESNNAFMQSMRLLDERIVQNGNKISALRSQIKQQTSSPTMPTWPASSISPVPTYTPPTKPLAGLGSPSTGAATSVKESGNTSAAWPALQDGQQWSVYCNECDQPTQNIHYHCNICDAGDFDLCQSCVDAGKVCPGEEHWLIKRSIKDGVVVYSVTERIPPKVKKTPQLIDFLPEVPKQMPGSFTTVTEAANEALYMQTPVFSKAPSRTCNNCVIVLPESQFVNCAVCEDFDLCISCFVDNRHGHHPAHKFAPTTRATILSTTAESMLAPGRNVDHAAICDLCDSKILGVRHKCQSCPDYDLCSRCILSASTKHPRHRFATLYEKLGARKEVQARHVGIYCDGQQCKSIMNQGCIVGPRYKCAICHDTDFCDNCEASPLNKHNKSHPLILFKTPVRGAVITTQNEDAGGNMLTLGDRVGTVTNSAPQPTPVVPASIQQISNTEIKVLADYKPSGCCDRETVAPSGLFSFSEQPTLDAKFVRDAVIDKTQVAPNTRFAQVWTLRNPGPLAWPAGCSLRFIGGDNMLDVDDRHPGPINDIKRAVESNVIARPVAAGEEVAFRVFLKAPMRLGTSISYWRVHHSGHKPFGDRLWCHIDVQADAKGSSCVKGDQVSMPSFWQAHRSCVDTPRAPQCGMTGVPAAVAHERALTSKYAKNISAQIAAKLANTSLDDAESSPALRESQMVFPKLEKESPASSIYQPAASTTGSSKVAYVENEAGVVENIAVPTETDVEAVATQPARIEIDADDETDDLEVLSAHSELSLSDSDDGFMTDEEYDILDASDRETIASP